MRKRLWGMLIGLTAAVGLAVPAGAQALTIGSLATSDPGACTPGGTSVWIVQTATASIPYVVPAGGGVITSWSTSFGPAGAPVELIVTGPVSGGTYHVVGLDAETIPNPVPAGNVSTFTPAHPITVQQGDLIGLFYTGSSSTRCLYPGTPSDTVAAGTTTPVVGNDLSPVTPSAANYLTNVRVNLVQSSDLALAATATPGSIAAGDLADLAFTVTADTPEAATFTDTVPAGLRPVLAAATTGSCTVAGQAVSCSLSGTPGTVHIVVQGATPGTFSDSGQVVGAIPDLNPANNAATVGLTVRPIPPTPVCTVPRLGGAPLSVARAVLPLLHCRVGKVTHVSSRRVPKGLVVSTAPGAGRKLAAGSRVAIRVSSGKPKRRRRHHK